MRESRFLRSAPFSGATVIAICAFGAFSGFLFLNTLYLQDVLGLSALQAGLCTLPLAVMTSIFAPLISTSASRGEAHPRPSVPAYIPVLRLAIRNRNGLSWLNVWGGPRSGEALSSHH